MNTQKLIGLLLLISGAGQVHASGCGGFERIEKREFIGRETVQGQFACQAFGENTQYCSFNSPGHAEYFVSAVTSTPPPVGQTLDQPFESFKAVGIDACDGHEVPVIVSETIYAGTTYANYR